MLDDGSSKSALAQEGSDAMACNSHDSQSSDRDRQKAFAERAMKLALALPDDVTCRNTNSETEGAFLSALRNLAAGYPLAHTWSESEARSRFESLTFADAAITYAFAVAAKGKPGGPEGEESPTARCNREKEKCKEKCDANPDAGYFCYFDCRLTFFACPAGTITGGGRGGGVVIA